MLRVLTMAVIVLGLAGAVAYVLATAGEDRAAETLVDAVSTDGEAATQSESSDPGPLREARIPHPPRNVTPHGVYTGPIRQFGPDPEPEAPAEELAAETVRTFPRVVVEEAGLLRGGDIRLRLADINAPALDAICTDASGSDWSCGRAARGALRLLLRNRSVECRFAGGEADVRVARCTAGGRDLSEWLVAQGWAEPAESGWFEAEFQAARDAQRGMFEAERSAVPPVPVTTQ